jgi:hypothetical protein
MKGSAAMSAPSHSLIIHAQPTHPQASAWLSKVVLGSQECEKINETGIDSTS